MTGMCHTSSEHDQSKSQLFKYFGFTMNHHHEGSKPLQKKMHYRYIPNI